MEAVQDRRAARRRVPSTWQRCLVLTACAIIHAIAWITLLAPSGIPHPPPAPHAPAPGILLLGQYSPRLKQVLSVHAPVHAAPNRTKEKNVLARPAEADRITAAAPSTVNSPARNDDEPIASGAGQAIDIEAIKKSIRRDVAGLEEKNRPASAMAARQTESPKPLAARPKCDEKYIPKIGSVGFDGLLKLPFLVKDAVTQSGCQF